MSLEAQAPKNSIGAITLPSSLMSNLPASEVELASRVQFNFFETPALFQVMLLLPGFALDLVWRWVTKFCFNHHVFLSLPQIKWSSAETMFFGLFFFFYPYPTTPDDN